MNHPSGDSRVDSRSTFSLWHYGAGVGLAVVATCLMVVTGDPRWLRVAALLGLWATLIVAFGAARDRRHARESAALVTDYQRAYEVELLMEVAARRDFEGAIAERALEATDTRYRHELDEVRYELSQLSAGLKAGFAYRSEAADEHRTELRDVRRQVDELTAGVRELLERPLSEVPAIRELLPAQGIGPVDHTPLAITAPTPSSAATAFLSLASVSPPAPANESPSADSTSMPLMDRPVAVPAAVSSTTEVSPTVHRPAVRTAGLPTQGVPGTGVPGAGVPGASVPGASVPGAGTTTSTQYPPGEPAPTSTAPDEGPSTTAPSLFPAPIPAQGRPTSHGRRSGRRTQPSGSPVPTPRSAVPAPLASVPEQAHAEAPGTGPVRVEDLVAAYGRQPGSRRRRKD